jgi:oligoribonuclease
MSEPLDAPLVWVDLEMTGLDPDAHAIVELAVIVTDGELERIIEGPDLVIGQPAELVDTMEQVVVDMHTSSGLLDEIRTSDVTIADAEQQALAFVQSWVPEPRTAPLAGNSVHADRAFLRRYMPDLAGYLHYRNVDVSTVKELARRWYPEAMRQAPRKDGNHRALADIRESIEELRWFRSTIFRPLEAPES